MKQIPNFTLANSALDRFVFMCTTQSHNAEFKYQLLHAFNKCALLNEYATTSRIASGKNLLRNFWTQGKFDAIFAMNLCNKTVWFVLHSMFGVRQPAFACIRWLYLIKWMRKNIRHSRRQKKLRNFSTQGKFFHFTWLCLCTRHHSGC